jgi:hypothetical protein
LKYTSSQIMGALRGVNFLELPYEGYIPTYTRTDVTDALHEAFDFRTDRRIVTKKRSPPITQNLAPAAPLFP